MPSLFRRLPSILTFAVLIGIAWWGHRTGWSVSPAPATTTNVEGGADWCPEHGLYEADCLLCHKDLAKAQRAQEPPAQVYAGEDILFAQVATEAVLAKVGITTAPVEERAVTPRHTVVAETRFRPHQLARLAPRASGVITHVMKHLGDQVAAGELCAVVESGDVGTAKSALLHAVSEAQASAAAVRRAQASVASGYGSSAEIEIADSQARNAQVAVFAAEQALLNLGFSVSAGDLTDLESLAVRLRTLGLPEAHATSARSANLLPVFAPCAGRVIESFPAIGEAVTGGQSIAVIADTSTLDVVMQVSPTVAAMLAPGQSLIFRSDSGSEALGSIAVVGIAVDETTRLVPVYGKIDNPERRLPANLYGQVIITMGPEQRLVVVPPAAVQYDGDTAYVFVRRSPTIFRGLPVRILERTEDGLAVDRLLPGDEIVVSGSAALKGSLFPEQFGPGCACGGD